MPTRTEVHQAILDLVNRNWRLRLQTFRPCPKHQLRSPTVPKEVTQRGKAGCDGKPRLRRREPGRCYRRGCARCLWRTSVWGRSGARGSHLEVKGLRGVAWDSDFDLESFGALQPRKTSKGIE